MHIVGYAQLVNLQRDKRLLTRLYSFEYEINTSHYVMDDQGTKIHGSFQ